MDDSFGWFAVSDDEEVDYSVKAEFYGSDLDDKDEKWVEKKRHGRASDAVLSCPGCFTTLCLECQRYNGILHALNFVRATQSPVLLHR